MKDSHEPTKCLTIQAKSRRSAPEQEVADDDDAFE